MSRVPLVWAEQREPWPASLAYETSSRCYGFRSFKRSGIALPSYVTSC